MASHTGMTTAEFEEVVADWIATARHPSLQVPYTDLVFQPMLELLDYLGTKGFTTFIVSGGGIEFMRPWVERVYGIPPERVIGSSIKVVFEMRDGTARSGQAAGDRLHRRQAGKAGGDPQVHRPAPHRRLRQLRW